MKDLLMEFQGVIGAILGSLSTLISTHFLKNAGKVKLKLIDYEVYLYKEDEIGGLQPSNIKDAERANIYIYTEIYNPSDNIKSINNISFNLLNEKKEILAQNVAHDNKTHRISAARHQYDEFTFFNCESKKIIKKDLKVDVDPAILRESKYIRISYSLMERKIFSRKHVTVLIKI